MYKIASAENNFWRITTSLKHCDQQTFLLCCRYYFSTELLEEGKKSMQQRLLLEGWQCKQRSNTAELADDFASHNDWIPATVPGSIHQDLLAAGRIPDPFIGLNELDVQWIGEADWLYRTSFEWSGSNTSKRIVLCFDGLDTFATVWLNGTQILSSDNMFVPQRIDITQLIQSGTNSIHCLFESAVRKGKEREAQYGVRPMWNEPSHRLYVRKAQYHYSWDWGPSLVTAGLWQPVRLETYSARIADIHCPVEVSNDLQQAILPVKLEIELVGQAVSAQKVIITLADPTGKVISEQSYPLSGSTFAETVTVDEPQLWWPNGYGKQPLYRLTCSLQDEQGELDRRELRLGLRRVRLQQLPLPDQTGTSFFFEINNTPIFCGGANWIPADSFTPRITPERYRAWLQLAVEGNMQMIRVWGGGIYESDTFYDLCDEMGLLVWQDFLFACGIYPAYDWFQESVRVEAEANIRRLRHHPSLVLWCGNNEDYSVAQAFGKRYDVNFEGDFTQTDFPARQIYERLLPEICSQLDPTRSYWPGSPYGGADAGSFELGDSHIWGIWHGAIPYQDYPKMTTRFASEFGMQAYPDLATIQTFAPEDELYPQSRTIEFHNKAGGAPRLFAPYLMDNVRMTGDLEGFIYITQFVQSEALGAAFRGWRRRWQGPGHEYTSGVLVWQLNDCWPVTSWAIADYYLRTKPAYYTVKRELAPFTVGAQRTAEQQVALWAVNGTLQAAEGELELSVWSLNGELISTEHRPIELLANRASELEGLELPAHASQIVAVRLVQGEKVLARTVLWPEPFKYLHFSEPEITIERLDETHISVQAQRPAKGVVLSSSNPEAHIWWSDNMLDLVPGDIQVIEVRGLGESQVTVRWLQ